ncbi:unnamed protein product [Arctogadus glacialis]
MVDVRKGGDLVANKHVQDPHIHSGEEYAAGAAVLQPVTTTLLTAGTRLGGYKPAGITPFRGTLAMVSPTMKALVDVVWAVWSIGASIYDYMNTSAMEERIHSLEDVISLHQCVIGALSAGVVMLFTYILLKKI